MLPAGSVVRFEKEEIHSCMRVCFGIIKALLKLSVVNRSIGASTARPVKVESCQKNGGFADGHFGL